MSGFNHVLADALRLRQADASVLGDLLDAAPSLVLALRCHPRTTSRLVALAADTLGALPDAISTSQQRLLRMDAAALLALSHRVGAVRHAAAILRIIDGVALRFLIDELGVAARNDALRWHAVSATLPTPREDLSLTDRVTRDGLAGLYGWCDAQPQPVGARVRLLLPYATTTTTESEAIAGRQIIEAIMADND